MSNETDPAPCTMIGDPVAPQTRGTKRPRALETGNDGLSALSIDPSGAACHRCRARKVKCGGELPTCAGCLKANVRCMVHDPDAPRAYTRQEFQQLYEKAQRLERELRDVSSSLPPNGDAQHRVRCQRTVAGRQHTPPVESLTAGYCSKTVSGQTSPKSGRRISAPAENRFVEQDTAFGYFLSQLHSSRGQGISASHLDRPDPRTLTTRMLYHPPHPFPSHDIALDAIRSYFENHHPAHPILSPEATYDALDKHALESNARQVIDASSLFRLFMAIAIGSIRLFRQGRFDLHPFGYFTAALEVWTPSTSSFNTVADIEHLLLIAQFGIYYDIGCSVWELGRLSMRSAVELGLHHKSPRLPACDSALQMKRSRRVFWMTYMLDRSSSCTLGRPFAIDDTSITAPLPEAVTSHEVSFNWFIGLSRIKSQIRCDLRPKRGSSAKEPMLASHSAVPAADDGFGRTITLLRKFNSQLREWRAKAPSEDEPRCAIEAPLYFDILYQEARLGLLRAAIEKLTINASSPHKSLLHPTLSAACSIISSFNSLRQVDILTCTRAEAHLVFVASLVVLSLAQYSANLNGERSAHDPPDIDEDPWFNFLEDGCYQITSESVSHILSSASQLLSWLSEDMPDFAVCARFFDETRHGSWVPRSGCAHRTEGANRACLDNHVQNVPGADAANEYVSSNHSTANFRASVRDTSSGEGRPTGYATFPSRQTASDDPNNATTELAPASDLLDISSQSLTEDFGIPIVPGVPDLSWPFSDVEGLAALDACFSGYVWDTYVPWEESPSVYMESL